MTETNALLNKDQSLKSLVSEAGAMILLHWYIQSMTSKELALQLVSIQTGKVNSPVQFQKHPATFLHSKPV